MAERQLGWFAGRAQSLVKSGQDGIMPTGDERGHVEAAADRAPPAKDAPFALHFAAVAIKGSDSRERGRLPAVEAPQLRHLGEEQGCAACADAAKGGQLLRFARQFLRLCDHLADQLVDRFELLLNLPNKSSTEPAQARFTQLRGPVLLRHQERA